MKLKKLKYWKQMANIFLLLLSELFAISLIQHALFFYSFPPDPSRYISVQPMAYITLALAIFLFIKLQHVLLESAEIIDGDKV